MALNFLKRIFGNGNGSAGDLLLPVAQFRTLILHECARCDRNAHAFSLVLIDLREINEKDERIKGARVRQLCRSIIHRMRNIDELGWIDDHSIGVFLPETNQMGAETFAKSACKDFSFQIYTYPCVNGLNYFTRNDDQNRLDCDTKAPLQGSGPDQREMETEQQANANYGSRGEALFNKEDKAVSIAHAKNGKNLEELVMPPGPPMWKRAYDIIGATVLLITFSPLFLLVALYIKIVSPGPVFFRQERIGYLGKPFVLIKFRTMKVTTDNVTVHKNYLNNLIKTEGQAMIKLDTAPDERLIPLAGLLRRSCIDELPQFINVLKGEMSLVGPRPCLDYEARDFAIWQRRRFHTAPGMTGLWQVSGKNRLTFKEMMRLDIRYTDKKNVALDMIISLKTVPAIVGQLRDVVFSKLTSAPKAPAVAPTLQKDSLQSFIRQLFL